MADNKAKWQEATRSILAALDLRAEYIALGLRVCDGKPNSKGWIEAHAPNVEDHTPSAGINVVDGPFLGRFKNFRTGESMTLFDFVARSGKFGGDWKQARNHYARITKIELPGGEDELVADRFDFYDLTYGIKSFYCEAKEGITPRAIDEVGGRGARWPRKLAAEKTNNIIAFPMYGSALLDLEPTGWHCVPQKAKGKIRKYRGEGAPLELLDKMTLGEYGLMNVDGLSRLADAEVVWIVEGITDLLALQAVLSPWRELDPDNRKHVALSAGACSYHPKPEWMHHFGGKNCLTCLDVGDKDSAGQVAAAVWVSALLPVAKSVRNVQLPLGKDGGKNDLRAWLIAGHNYADLLVFSESFEPVEPSDAAAQLSPHEAILKNLGIIVIGEHEHDIKIEVYSEHTQKPSTIHDIDRLSLAKLMQFVGAEPVEQYVHDGKEPQPGKFQMKDVRHAIAVGASGKRFRADDTIGAGVSEVDHQLIILRHSEAGLLNGSGKIEVSKVPFYKGRVLDITSEVGDWCDLSVVNHLLAKVQSDEFCQQTFAEAEKLFSNWNWRDKNVPRVVTSLVICTWIQSLWEWRPQVFITGETDSGKSMLTEDVLLKGIFGKLCLYVSKATEASIRQFLRYHNKILIVDEFEDDRHRQRILEMFRTSSRGGVVIRGTSDQRGVKYKLNHIPWFVTTETGLRKQPDLNRYLIFEINPPEADIRGKTDFIPSVEVMHDLGMRLFAVALRHYQEARRLAHVIKAQQVKDVPGRLVECLSVPMGMFGAVYRMTDEEAILHVRTTTETWDFSRQAGGDAGAVLAEILGANVMLSPGEKKTVAYCLSRYLEVNCADALLHVGIRRVQTKDITEVEAFWMEPKKVRKELLRESDFYNQKIDEHLLRIRGAKRTRQRLGGNTRHYGIQIPMSQIEEMFEHKKEGEEGEDTQTAPSSGF